MIIRTRLFLLLVYLTSKVPPISLLDISPFTIPGIASRQSNMVANSDQPLFCPFLLSYIIIYSFMKHAVAVPVHLSTTTHDTKLTPTPHPMIPNWKRTLANSISKKQFVSESHPTNNAMRSGPLAAVFRATLSTASSTLCTAKRPYEKCEVGLNGFGTFGEVHYEFNNTDKNLLGRSTQVLISCRCLSDDCQKAILVRRVKVMKRDQDGDVVSSGKNVCLYEAVKNKFSDCHRELFRVSYRNRDRRGQNNESETSYSVHDEHHGDYWNASGHLETERECLDTEINRLQHVRLSNLTEQDIGLYDRRNSEPFPCVPPADMQYFRADDENEDEICEKTFEHALASAVHIASQQDCFGVGKREISFMNPRSAVLITDTELALICSSAVLGILWLWSVYWKQLRRVKRATRMQVLAVLLQVILSYILEALPLHTALSNEVKGRDWRSLIAFTDATSSRTSNEANVGGILMMTIVLGEAQYLGTRVGLVAGLTVLFDSLALTLGILILIRMSGCCRANHEENIESESFTKPIGSPPKREPRLSFSSSETSDE